MKRLISFLLVVLLALTGITFMPEIVHAEETAAEELTMVAREQKRFWVPGEKKDVKWSSSDKKVATVTKKGIVKAQNAGSAVITAKGKTGTKTWNLTVLPYLSDEMAAAGENIAREYGRYGFADPDSVVITKVERGKYVETGNLIWQNDYDFKVYYTAKNSSGQSINWFSRYSSDRGYSLHSEAQYSSDSLTGTTEYTFSSEELARLNDLMKLYRAGEYAQDSEISISTHTLAIRAGSTYTISINNSDKKVKWKSSKKNIASIKNGTVTALKPGKTKITASVDGKKLTCELYVLDGSYTDNEMKVMKYLGYTISEVYSSKDFKVTEVKMGDYKSPNTNNNGPFGSDNGNRCAQITMEAKYTDDTMGTCFLEEGGEGGIGGWHYGDDRPTLTGTDTKIWTQDEIDKLNEMLQDGVLSGTVVYPVEDVANKTISMRMLGSGTTFVAD